MVESYGKFCTHENITLSIKMQSWLVMGDTHTGWKEISIENWLSLKKILFSVNVATLNITDFSLHNPTKYLYKFGVIAS